MKNIIEKCSIIIKESVIEKLVVDLIFLHPFGLEFKQASLENASFGDRFRGLENYDFRGPQRDPKSEYLSSGIQVFGNLD